MDDELRTFLAIVDTGSFTAAARSVHRTQPAISAAMHRLEDWASARLLERRATGSVPTQAGSALLPHARAVIAALDDAQRAVSEIVGLSAGEVRIGAGATACSELLPPHLARFHITFPSVAVRLRETDNTRLGAMLADGRLDIAILTGGVPVPKGVVQEPWLHDELVLVRAPNVHSTDVVTFWEGSAIRRLLLAKWPDATIGMELGSVAAVTAHVLQGVGTALLSRLTVDRYLSDGDLQLVRRAGFPLRRELVLGHRGIDRLSPAASKLRGQLLRHRSPPT